MQKVSFFVQSGHFFRPAARLDTGSMFRFALSSDRSYRMQNPRLGNQDRASIIQNLLGLTSTDYLFYIIFRLRVSGVLLLPVSIVLLI